MSGKQKTKVVIVGGGFGGVKTALNLANNPKFQVQLISDNTHFEYHGALYRSAVGHSPMEVVIPLKEIFQDTDVDLILDSAGFVDHTRKRIASISGTIYPYDKLVLALGNTVNYFNLDGMQQHTETMHDIASTVKLRHSLVNLFKKSHQHPLRIVVVGAGASGVELAGEIPAFARLIAKRYNVAEARLKVILIDGSDRILPMLSAKLSNKAMQRLYKLGIEIHLNTKVSSCEPGNLCLSAGNLGADLIIWTAGSKPVDFYNKNAIFTLGRGGRVVVDEYLQAQNVPDIYVIGDNADTRYSGMAQTALWDANFISRNLIREAKHQKPRRYRTKKPLFVVTVGQKWAVVEDGKKLLSGKGGWVVRRQADLAIFRNFQPYKAAVKTWRQANKMSRF